MCYTIRPVLKSPLLGLIFLIVSCSQPPASQKSKSGELEYGYATASSSADTLQKKPANAAQIMARKEVPVLCYHQIRNWTASDSKSAKDYIVPVSTFKAQIKMLADSGYQPILPDELYEYLVYGKTLPEKPVMITFDDGVDDQYTIANKELKKYGFKAAYFIMTVATGRPNFMTSEQIRHLQEEGNSIGHHTWDHQNVKKYSGKDWEIQIERPAAKLAEITGKPVDYFAYPFGLWNGQAIPELKKRGIKAAYILSTSRDSEYPLYTIRRIIASGYWSLKTLHSSMVNSFK